MKISHVKKACVGERGELERKLNDVIGTGSTVRSCCKSDFRKTSLNQPSCKILKRLGQELTLLSVLYVKNICCPRNDLSMNSALQ